MQRLVGSSSLARCGLWGCHNLQDVADFQALNPQVVIDGTVTANGASSGTATSNANGRGEENPTLSL